MPSFGKCAALVAGLFGASAMASPHGHSARAIHQKKDVASAFFRNGVLAGQNKETGPIALDGGKGAYVVEIFNNNTESDIDIILWSATGQQGTWSALTVNVTPPNVTTTIPAGGNVSISFNPALYTAENGFPGADCSISGALGVMTKDSVLSFFGGISGTWFEWTFVHNQPWSTMDVSRLAGKGVDMKAISYPTKGGEQACVSDMETCVYKCPNGEDTCLVAENDFPCNGQTGCRGYGNDGGYTALYIG